MRNFALRAAHRDRLAHLRKIEASFHLRWSIGSYLDDGRDLEFLAWRILTNPQDSVADHAIRWRGEIIWRRHALVDAAGQVEFRAVARAEKPSGPVRGRLDIARGRIIERNAAEMRADADENGVGGIDRAMPVPSVARLLQDFRVGIGKLGEQRGVLQFLQRRIRPPEDHHRQPAPAHDHFPARLEPAKIDVDRRASGNAGGVRVQRIDQRPDRGRRRHDGARAGRDVKNVPAERVSLNRESSSGAPLKKYARVREECCVWPNVQVQGPANSDCLRNRGDPLGKTARWQLPRPPYFVISASFRQSRPMPQWFAITRTFAMLARRSDPRSARRPDKTDLRDTETG